ncbi:hypothetical protein LZ32DRAFT_391924 [Colletotrichum eremochloae]|nr:hypothetical protein LZ32DRAFT_391924 [Colletotrichum eremochloae]
MELCYGSPDAVLASGAPCHREMSDAWCIVHCQSRRLSATGYRRRISITAAGARVRWGEFLEADNERRGQDCAGGLSVDRGPRGRTETPGGKAPREDHDGDSILYLCIPNHVHG